MKNRHIGGEFEISPEMLIPIPDGSWVKTQYKLATPQNEGSHFLLNKLIGAILKINREDSSDDTAFLDYFNLAEQMLDSNLEPNAMNKVSETPYNNINFSEASRIRIVNDQFVMNSFTEIGVKTLFPISILDKYVPLFIPILAKDNQKLRRHFMSRNIYLPIHWPIHTEYRKQLVTGCKYENNELSLIN